MHHSPIINPTWLKDRSVWTAQKSLKHLPSLTSSCTDILHLTSVIYIIKHQVRARALSCTTPPSTFQPCMAKRQTGQRSLANLASSNLILHRYSHLQQTCPTSALETLAQPYCLIFLAPPYLRFISCPNRLVLVYSIANNHQVLSSPINPRFLFNLFYQYETKSIQADLLRQIVLSYVLSLSAPMDVLFPSPSPLNSSMHPHNR